MQDNLMQEMENDKDYQIIVKHVLNLEGGLANLKHDTGGVTNYGISYNNNAGILTEYGIYSPNDMVKLTPEMAKEIYYIKYYKQSHCDELHDIRLKYLIFDVAVNQGVGTAQRFLFSLDPDPRNFQGDGQNESLMLHYLLELFIERMEFYLHCPSEQKRAFLEGWMNRLVNWEKTSEKLLSERS